MKLLRNDNAWHLSGMHSFLNLWPLVLINSKCHIKVARKTCLTGYERIQNWTKGKHTHTDAHTISFVDKAIVTKTKHGLQKKDIQQSCNTISIQCNNHTSQSQSFDNHKIINNTCTRMYFSVMQKFHIWNIKLPLKFKIT